MRRPILVAVLALLAACALPGVSQAAPVKLSPKASAVSERGVATIEAANPTPMSCAARPRSPSPAGRSRLGASACRGGR
jgi:hypothetical protein